MSGDAEHATDAAPGAAQASGEAAPGAAERAKDAAPGTAEASGEVVSGAAERAKDAAFGAAQATGEAAPGAVTPPGLSGPRGPRQVGSSPQMSLRNTWQTHYSRDH